LNKLFNVLRQISRSKIWFFIQNNQE